MMGYSKSDRIYDKHNCIRGANRRFGNGKKKKARRKIRAFHADGWSRKRAGGLTPQLETSKTTLKEEKKWEGMN